MKQQSSSIVHIFNRESDKIILKYPNRCNNWAIRHELQQEVIKLLAMFIPYVWL